MLASSCRFMPCVCLPLLVESLQIVVLPNLRLSVEMKILATGTHTIFGEGISDALMFGWKGPRKGLLEHSVSRVCRFGDDELCAENQSPKEG